MDPDAVYKQFYTMAKSQPHEPRIFAQWGDFMAQHAIQELNPERLHKALGMIERGLMIEQRVVLTGLKARPELNGKEGKVRCGLDPRGDATEGNYRIPVLVDGQAEPISLLKEKIICDELNSKFRCEDKELGIFHLMLASYQAYLWEKDDTSAAELLEKTRKLLETVGKVDGEEKIAPLREMFAKAAEQRVDALSQLERLSGKDQNSQKDELIKILDEQIDKFRKETETDPANLESHNAFGLAQMRKGEFCKQVGDIGQAMKMFKQSIATYKQMNEKERTSNGLVMLASVLRESAFMEDGESKASAMLDEAAQAFEDAILIEHDPKKKEQLQKELPTTKEWKNEWSKAKGKSELPGPRASPAMPSSAANADSAPGVAKRAGSPTKPPVVPGKSAEGGIEDPDLYMSAAIGIGALIAVVAVGVYFVRSLVRKSNS